MESGIGRKIFKSLTWVGGANLISQILSWAITIVIVRHLSPGDYGLMAMAVVFWGFLAMIGDFGLFASIVQSKEISDIQLREIFGFIIILNVLFLIVTYLAAPVVSIYFSEPRLTAILRTLGIVFIFIPFYIIPHSLLLREMSFHITSVIDVSCNLFSAVAALLFAINGYGVWSLVYSALLQYCIRAMSFTLVSRKYYSPLFYMKQIKGMLSFSSFFTGATILRYLFFKSDILIAGRFIGPEALGIYSIANQLAFTPVEKMSSIIPQVAFPAFSRTQSDVNTYSDNFLTGLKLLNMIFIPCYIVIFFLAEDIVHILLGPKWENIILPIRILCIAMPLRAIEVMFIPAINGLGRSDITMMTSGLSLLIMICAFLVGINWGYIGLCWAWVGGYSIIYIIIVSISIKSMRIEKSAVIGSYKTAVVSSMGVAFIGILMMRMSQDVLHPLLKIVTYCILSIILYSISLYYVDRRMIHIAKKLYSERKAA